jgi:hypothetical protein
MGATRVRIRFIQSWVVLWRPRIRTGLESRVNTRHSARFGTAYAPNAWDRSGSPPAGPGAGRDRLFRGRPRRPVSAHPRTPDRPDRRQSPRPTAPEAPPTRWPGRSGAPPTTGRNDRSLVRAHGRGDLPSRGPFRARRPVFGRAATPQGIAPRTPIGGRIKNTVPAESQSGSPALPSAMCAGELDDLADRHAAQRANGRGPRQGRVPSPGSTIRGVRRGGPNRGSPSGARTLASLPRITSTSRPLPLP